MCINVDDDDHKMSEWIRKKLNSNIMKRRYLKQRIHRQHENNFTQILFSSFVSELFATLSPIERLSKVKLKLVQFDPSLQKVVQHKKSWS